MELVSHINDAKKIVHVKTSRQEFCLLHYDRLPDAATLKLGMFVEIKIKKDTI